MKQGKITWITQHGPLSCLFTTGPTKEVVMIRIGRVVVDETQVSKVVHDSKAKSTVLYGSNGVELATFNKYHQEAFDYFAEDAENVAGE